MGKRDLYSQTRSELGIRVDRDGAIRPLTAMQAWQKRCTVLCRAPGLGSVGHRATCCRRRMPSLLRDRRAEASPKPMTLLRR
jgi:hypothetical protein